MVPAFSVITGLNDGQSQGGFAVDGYSVFFATHDGKIWRYDIPVPTGVAETASPALQVFPVPANDVLSVKYAFPQEERQTISLYDMFGRKMECPQSSLTNTQTDLDVAALAPGCYLLVAETSSGKFSQRVIITHGD